MTDQALIETYIERDPARPGPAFARVIGHTVHVWALIGYLRAVDGDVARVAEEYELSEESMRAAIAYYRRYHEHIDAWLLLNSAED